MLAEATPQPASATALLLPIFGALGVIVGALITLAGQTAGQRAERRNEIEKLAADLAGSTYLMESGLKGLIGYLELGPEHHSEALAKVHTDAINIEVDRTASLGNQLSIRAASPLRLAAISLANACVDAQNYLHPVVGTGIPDKFENGVAVLCAIGVKREEMIEVARSIHPLTPSERISALWRVLRKKPSDD